MSSNMNLTDHTSLVQRAQQDVRDWRELTCMEECNPDWDGDARPGTARYAFEAAKERLAKAKDDLAKYQAERAQHETL